MTGEEGESNPRVLLKDEGRTLSPHPRIPPIPPPLAVKLLFKQHVFQDDALVVFFGLYCVQRTVLGNSLFPGVSIHKNSHRTHGLD